jgi:alkanesulfonate monooxygenase SsuD/methylene tetrahydromethanopterin reductase-like flavin-dependent oxidoreductase (luciferase family)
MPRAAAASALVCVAVDARFLQAGDVAGLRAEAERAGADGADVIFVSRGTLGDPFVLAAGLSLSVPRALVGVRLGLSEDGRHPAILAREVTSLDLVCGGRSVLCFTPPFDGRLAEAIALCRALWREGEADSTGPHFPVHAAVNRPRPAGTGSPLVALDLTGGDELPDVLADVADLLVHGTDDAAVGRVERA